MNSTAATLPDPITIRVRVFPDDDRCFHWELSVWRGDVDLTHATPDHRMQSMKAYKSKRVAYTQGLAAAGRVVL